MHTTVSDIRVTKEITCDIDEEQIAFYKQEKWIAKKNENANKIRVHIKKSNQVVDLSTSEISGKMFFTTPNGQLITINGTVGQNQSYIDTEQVVTDAYIDFELTSDCIVQGKFRADVCINKGVRQRTIAIIEGNIV